MKRWQRLFAALTALLLLIGASASGEGLTQAAEVQLGENGVQANDGEGYVPAFEPWVIDAEGKTQTHQMKVRDTCRIYVSNAELTECTAAKKGIVSIGPVLRDEAGVAYVDVTAEAACKKLKLTFAVSGSKKKKISATLVIGDPFVPDALSFGELPPWLPVGSSLYLPDYVVTTPSYASRNFTWKVSGAGKVDKNGLMTAAKPGKATITVTAAGNKKVKATAVLDVYANEVSNLSGKPGAGDFGGIAGKWTLWPVSVGVNKKGGVDCQLYVLNATGEKASQIENLVLTVSAGARDNVLAQKSFAKVKAGAANGNYKLVKLTLSPTAAIDGVFLPALSEAGALIFGVNADVTLSGKSARFPYAATKIPDGSGGGGGADDDFYIADGVVRGYSGDGGDIAIPAAGPDGVPVSEIDVEAFKNQTAITGVTMPDTVKLIREFAFEGCANMKRIHFSASLETIGSFAFNNCASLDDVVFPNTLKAIGLCAFQNCGAISSLDFPESLTTLEDYVFSGCNGVTTVSITKNMGADIADQAFLGMGGVREFKVDPENTVFSTVNGALANREGWHIIAGPCGATGLYALPEGVSSLGYAAFAGAQLSAIALPESLIWFNGRTFAGCQNLTAITIPWQVTVLPNELFSGCAHLARVTFHGYVYKWGNNVFNECDSLNTFAGYDNADVHRIANEMGLTYEIIPKP